jgi:hypothetical protein
MTPTAFGGLDDEHPGALSDCGIAGSHRDDVRQLFDNTELLVPIQDADRRQHLNATRSCHRR